MKILNPFKNAIAWFKTLLGKDTAGLKKRAQIAIDVVNVIKKVVESGAVKMAVSFTPTHLDNEIRLKLETKILPEVLRRFALANAIIKNSDSYADLKDAVVKWIAEVRKDGRGELYNDLAAMILDAFADGKITKAELKQIIHEVYNAVTAPAK